MRDLSKMNMNKIMNRAGKNAETSKANNPPSDRKECRSQYDRSRGFRNNDQRGSGWNARPQGLLGEPRPRKKRSWQTDEAMRNIEGEFHNPYTFIPFPDKSPERHNPSFLTVDENTTEKRYTGVLNLTIETVSPLLSMDSENKKPEGGHFKYKALKIGNDVIVPATSVRGSLRTLMTILSGGTLGYMDKDMWLCQGRDLSMNIYGKNGAKKTELAEIVEPGDSFHDGKIQRGTTKMVSLGALSELFRANDLQLNDFRPQKDKAVKYLYVDDDLTKLAEEWSSETPWKLKLSGTRIPHKYSRNASLDDLKKLFAEYGCNVDDYRPVKGTAITYRYVDGNLTQLSEKWMPETPWKLALDRDRRKGGDMILSVDSTLVESKVKELELYNSKELWVDSPTEMTSVSSCPDKEHPRYFLKYDKYGPEKYELNTYGQEAVFLRNDSAPEKVDEQKWGDYSSQNQHGNHPRLSSGDLVWLELDENSSAKSLQWARWGRGGANSDRFRDVLPEYLIPDSMQTDNKVDMVTDMFGMVNENKDGVSFASRVRCHNLVFRDAAVGGLDENVELAPLAQPHPGCLAFYRPEDEKLNGYKVYRNAIDGEKPWLYRTQGIYKSGWNIEPFDKQKIVKKVDLLKSGRKGKLKISFRALSEKELSLLLTACKVDWKLGGGKPLGLGHCKVTQMEAVDENGDLIDLNAIAPMEKITERVEWYKKSQEPVKDMLYPRAVDRRQHSGLQWFSRHANPMSRKGMHQRLPSILEDDQHLYGRDK